MPDGVGCVYSTYFTERSCLENSKPEEKKKAVNVSELMANYLKKPIRQAFYRYLYRKASGRGDNITLIFPHEIISGFNTERRTEEYPDRQGFIVPKSRHEFVTLVSAQAISDTTCDHHSDLQDTDLQDAFGDSQSCVITGNDLYSYYSEFVQSLPWQDIIRQVCACDDFYDAAPVLCPRFCFAKEVNDDLGMNEAAERLSHKLKRPD